MLNKNRCNWCGNDPLYQVYHDTEWGRPLRDERLMWEFLCLESMQAGLSWITILRKRKGYRQAFYGFDPVRMAAMTEDEINQHLQNPDIIRNRRKVLALRKNAQCYLKLIEKEGSSVEYFWKFVDNRPIINNWKSLEEVPAQTELSQKISKDLKKRGFCFVGPTIVYAFMQATGMVMDHVEGCFIREELI